MAGRIELKYLVDHHARARLLAAWNEYLVPAPYTDDRAMYPIMSLYFDSPSLAFYDEKVEGEMLRNKVRLRGYGYDWKGLDPCILEIKRKVDSRILKFRKNLGIFRREFWDPAAWDLDGDPQGEQVAALALRHNLRPAVQILYQRETYESPYCPGLRIAFDSHLVALHPEEEMRSEIFEDRRRRCLGDTQYIFEVKSNGAMPNWVLSAIHGCQLQVRSLSKYVIGIEKLHLQNCEIGVYA